MTATLECGHILPPTNGGVGTGYGVDPVTGERRCYDCCAERGIEIMRRTGRAVLYLDGDCLTDWPGRLRFPLLRRTKGAHNMAGTREDVWFTLDGHEWHGTQYGRWSTVAHCKRTRVAVSPT